MPGILGNVIVLAVLAVVVVLAVRSLWRSHRSGGHCNGDCGSCGGCHGGGCSRYLNRRKQWKGDTGKETLFVSPFCHEGEDQNMGSRAAKPA